MSSFIEKFRDMPAEKQQYVLQTLPTHLANAGQQERLRHILTTFHFLQAKVKALGVQALIEDFESCTEPRLRLVQEALRLSAYILARDPNQLAPQLLGRLFPESPMIETLLQQIQQSASIAWLRPITPTLTRPGGVLLRTLTGVSGDGSPVAVTHDGRLAVSSGDEGTLKVWHLEYGTEILTLAGHAKKILAVAVTPDGRYAISASLDGVLKVWNLDYGKELYTLEGHTGRVTGVAITTDGRRGISASGDKTLKVWDLDRGKELYTLTGHTDAVEAVAMTLDGRRAISGGCDKVLKVWDLEHREELFSLMGHQTRILAVTLTSDGCLAVSSGFFGELKVWDLEHGLELPSLPSRTFSLALHTKMGQIISNITSHRDEDQRETFEQWETFKKEADNRLAIRAVAITPDGRRAVSSENDIIVVSDVQKREELGALTGHSDSVIALAMSSNGQRAVSSSRDRTLKVWNLNRITPIRRLEQPHTRKVQAIAMTPDGRLALSASEDAKLVAWDVKRGNRLPILLGFSQDSEDELHIYQAMRDVTLLLDGRRAISASEDMTLKLWDLEKQGREVRTLRGHKDEVWAVAATPDGMRAVSGGRDKILFVWDLTSNEPLYRLTGHTNAITSAAITPDGRRAISASSDHTLRVWDLEQGIELSTLIGHTDGINGVTTTLDGQRAISASSDHTLRVWDLEQGIELSTLTGHNDMIWAVSITPNGQRAVSVSQDATLIVWDVERAAIIATFYGDGVLRACDIAWNGTTIVAGSDLGQVHFLELEGVEVLKVPTRRTTMAPDHSYAEPGGITCPRCARDLDISLYIIVDADERPDLMRQFKNDSLNAFTCPHCGWYGKVESMPLLFFFSKGTQPLPLPQTVLCLAKDDDRSPSKVLIPIFDRLIITRGQAWADRILSSAGRSVCRQETLRGFLAGWNGYADKVSNVSQEADRLRQMVLRRIRDLREQNRPNVSNPFYLDRFTGYNIAAWADKGYNAAINTLEMIIPDQDESTNAYAVRVGKHLHNLKDSYYEDPEDRDGGATGAVTDTIMALNEVFHHEDIVMPKDHSKIGRRNQPNRIVLIVIGVILLIILVFGFRSILGL